jgi:hypothetical protein
MVMRKQSKKPDVQSLTAIGWGFATLTFAVTGIAALLLATGHQRTETLQQTALETPVTSR